MNTVRDLFSNGSLVGLAFKDRKSFGQVLRLLDEKKDVPFALPGSRNVVVPRSELQWFRDKLKGVLFDEIEVVLASELPLSEREARRKEALSPAGAAGHDRDWKRSRIQDLKKRLGRS